MTKKVPKETSNCQKKPISKKNKTVRHWWLTAAILVTWEAEIGRTVV
jgi:hypothetical protein